MNLQPPRDYSPILGLPLDIGVNRPLFAKPDALLKLFGHAREKKLWGVVKFNADFTGPPGHAHGGAQAYVLDEVMGTVCWHARIPVVARSIHIDLKSMVPLHVEHVLTASVVKSEAGDVSVSAELKSQEGKIFATGQGRFHILTYDQFNKLAPGPHGDLSAWFKGSDTEP